MLKGMIGKVALLLLVYQDEGDVLLYTAMSSYIHIREIGDPTGHSELQGLSRAEHDN